MRTKLIPLLIAALGFGAATTVDAQSIGPQASELFVAGRMTPMNASADSGKAGRDRVTPIVIGAVVGFLVSSLFVRESDGPTSQQMLTGAVIGGGIGLLFGLIAPSPE
ncbi:MAG: hypothetical protein ABIQ41_07815 [Gemmatimonadales bacterium]